MGSQVIRIGIVGAGHNTRLKHIPQLRQITNVEIVSVCNTSRQSSERVSQDFGIPRIYDDWKKLIEADDTDAILIGTWPYLHRDITLAAMAADKHVLCEARMAADAEQARQMLQAAKEKPHLVTQVVPSPMTLEFDETIKKLIRDGFLGQLLVIELRAESQFIDPAQKINWRHNQALSGRNTMSLGIWYEAIMRWAGTARKVTAITKTFVSKRTDSYGKKHEIKIPDHVDIIAEMVCGAQMHMQVSSVTGLSDGPKAYLFGSEGTLCLAGNSLLGGRKTDRSLSRIQIDPALRGSWRVETEFINAIRGKERVKLTTFEDGVKYMEFTEAVVRSAQTGQSVTLENA